MTEALILAVVCDMYVCVCVGNQYCHTVHWNAVAVQPVVLFSLIVDVQSSAVTITEVRINSCYITGVAALNQYIYVVGGYDGQRQLNTVERYDTERDSWDFVSSIRVARSALSLTVLDGKLYAMGKVSLF